MPILDTLPEPLERKFKEAHARFSTERPLLPSTETLNLPKQEAGGVAIAEAPPETPAEPHTYEQIAFETDMDSEGKFSPEWLILEDRYAYVFAEGNTPNPRLIASLFLPDIVKAKAEMFFGNGTLELRTKTETLSLLRYSQTNVAEANLIARQINARAKGDPPPLESKESKKKRCAKCKRVLPPDSDVCPACINKKQVLMRLFQFLKPYKWLSAASVAVLIGLTVLGLLPPYVSGQIVDALRVPKDTDSSMQFVILMVGILAVAQLISAVLQYFQRRLNAWLGARILVDIRLAVYEKFQQLSLGYYDKRSIGSVMSRITNDSDALWDFLTDGIPWFVSNFLTLFGIGFILFKMNWQLALLLLIPAPFIYFLTKWFMPRAHRRWHHLWHRISKMYSALGSSLNGMRVVKAFAQEDKENNRFRDRNLQVFEASFAANAMWASYWPIIGLLMSLGSYIIWIVGGHKVLHTEMSLGELTAFNGYLWQFYAPFQNFSRVIDWLTRSMTAAERVFEVMDTDPDVIESAQPVSMPRIEGRIDFDNVSFSYDKGKRVLEEFSIKIEPGEMIGLVGHSGAGKSTIINLLSRFYDVSEGVIRVDGVDIREIQQADFRRQFGIVLQEPFLFPGTIRDNIAYAKADATNEDILRAAKAANCHEFILKFSDGYDTQVGERGARLSGGERQRISIARAILHNPRILILDEATASVDTETEKQIQEAIARLIEGRTTIAIAHRLSTLRNAHRLVVMKDGKMAECGSHDELMEEDGVYANLVKIQLEVNKLRAI